MREEQFESLLQDDLSWRKKEISDLLLMAQNSPQPDILLKSLILVLYSHWEGYIKKSAKLYLKYVSEKNKKIKDLTLNFKAIHLKNLSKACMDNQNSTSIVKEMELIEKYSSVDNIKFRISIDPDNDMEECIVDTKHNLNPKVLKNIFKLIGFYYWEPIESREQYLDANLLNNRNAIGHGSKIPGDSHQDFELNIIEIKKLKEIIVLILDLFKESLLYYQEKELYLIVNNGIRDTYNNNIANSLKDKLEIIENEG